MTYTLDKVRKMSYVGFMQSLSQLGTTEDLTDIVAYLTARRPMTTERLGFLCYFAYAWGLVILGREIAPFVFVQGAYGPTELMHSRIYPRYDVCECKLAPELDRDLELLLDIVLDTYGNLPIRDLEIRLMSHMRHIPAGRKITAQDIYIFFRTASLGEDNAEAVDF